MIRCWPRSGPCPLWSRTTRLRLITTSSLFCLRTRPEHRDGPRAPRCRPACRRSPTAAGCRAACRACAAVPMPVLWCAHDRHRDLRARLPAELAADTDQDRHVMSQTPCKQCGFPLPIRWPRAGGNLAQPNNIHRCADRASIRSKHPPKGLLRPAPSVSADTQVNSCQRHVYHRARRPH